MSESTPQVLHVTSDANSTSVKKDIAVMKDLSVYAVLLAGFASTLAALEVLSTTSAGGSVTDATSTDLELSNAHIWDGTVSADLSVRGENTVVLWGTTGAAMTAVVIGTCSSPFAAMMGGAFCVSAVAGTILMAFASMIATIISAGGGMALADVDDDLDRYFSWEYPSIPDGQSMYERV